MLLSIGISKHTSIHVKNTSFLQLFSLVREQWILARDPGKYWDLNPWASTLIGPAQQST